MGVQDVTMCGEVDLVVGVLGTGSGPELVAWTDGVFVAVPEIDAGGGGRAAAAGGPAGVVAMPSRATFYRLFDRVKAGRNITGSTRTSRSLANQPAGPFGAVTAPNG